MIESRIKSMADQVLKQNQRNLEDAESARAALWVTPSVPIQLDPSPGAPLVHGVLLNNVDTEYGCLLGVVQEAHDGTWDTLVTRYGDFNISIPLEHVVSAHVICR